MNNDSHKAFWWEKTVEYMFIYHAATHGKMMISPLDGHHERAADAIMKSNNQWLLIEFKRNKRSIETERAKYINYDLAKKRLSSSDNHHLIVYGMLNSQRHLELACQTYFSETFITDLASISSMGKTHEEFLSYVNQLCQLKKPIPVSTTDGRMSLDFSIVAGVSNETGKLTSMRLDHYCRTMNIALKMEIAVIVDREKSRDRGMEMER